MFSGQLAGGLSSEKSSLALVSLVSSPIGLFCFSKSLMMFLSILVSRYSCEDFFYHYQLDWLLESYHFFISIAATMVAFCAYFALKHHNHQGFPLIVILFSLFACLPILCAQNQNLTHTKKKKEGKQNTHCECTKLPKRLSN